MAPKNPGKAWKVERLNNCLDTEIKRMIENPQELKERLKLRTGKALSTSGTEEDIWCQVVDLLIHRFGLSNLKNWQDTGGKGCWTGKGGGSIPGRAGGMKGWGKGYDDQDDTQYDEDPCNATAASAAQLPPMQPAVVAPVAMPQAYSTTNNAGPADPGSDPLQTSGAPMNVASAQETTTPGDTTAIRLSQTKEDADDSGAWGKLMADDAAPTAQSLNAWETVGQASDNLGSTAKPAWQQISNYNDSAPCAQGYDAWGDTNWGDYDEEEEDMTIEQAINASPSLIQAMHPNQNLVPSSKKPQVIEWGKGSGLLHFAVIKGFCNFVEKAINEWDFDIDVTRVSDNATPMHLALEHRNDKMIDILYNLDAELGIKDSYGNTCEEAYDAFAASRWNIIWLDLEMSRGHYDRDLPFPVAVLEAAVVITDRELTEIDRRNWTVGGFAKEFLTALPDFHQKNFRDKKPGGMFTPVPKRGGGYHAGNNLFTDMMNSTKNHAQVEQELLDFIAEYCPERCCPIAGNSIQCDREVLMNCMPNVYGFIHHRIIDVSSLIGCCERWLPEKIYDWREAQRKTSNYNHRAMEDTLSSITSCQWLRKNIFVENDWTHPIWTGLWPETMLETCALKTGPQTAADVPEGHVKVQTGSRRGMDGEMYPVWEVKKIEDVKEGERTWEELEMEKQKNNAVAGIPGAPGGQDWDYNEDWNGEDWDGDWEGGDWDENGENKARSSAACWSSNSAASNTAAKSLNENVSTAPDSLSKKMDAKATASDDRGGNGNGELIGMGAVGSDAPGGEISKRVGALRLPEGDGSVTRAENQTGEQVFEAWGNLENEAGN